MDKAQALHSFWSGFGIPAIDENSAYDEKAKQQLGISDRYIAYEVGTGDIVTGPVALTASIWYRSTSWTDISQKAEAVNAAIGYGGYRAEIDGGYIWITKGSPFARRLIDEADLSWRRIIFNINAEFLTA